MKNLKLHHLCQYSYNFEIEVDSNDNEQTIENKIRARFNWDDRKPIVISKNGEYVSIKTALETPTEEFEFMGAPDPNFQDYLKKLSVPSNTLPRSSMPTEIFNKAIKSFYSFAVSAPKRGRMHAFNAAMEGREEKGDALKTSLLRELVAELEKASGDRNTLQIAYSKMIKDDAKYKVLERGQGMVTRFFGLETDSCKALKGIYEAMLAKTTSVFFSDMPVHLPM